MLDKQSKILLIVSSVTWALLFVLIGYIFYVNNSEKVVTNNHYQNVSKIEKSNKKDDTKLFKEAEKEPIKIEPVEVEPIKIEPKNELFDLSVSLCTNKYAEEIANAVLKYSKKYGYPLYVIYALIGTESDNTHFNDSENYGNFKPEADGGGYGCIGLMQVSPKHVLPEYNKYNNTSYTKEDLYNIDINIDIGLWHYNQFKKVSKSYTEQYIIYNVGYKKYTTKNNNWYYDMNDLWVTGTQNSFFYNNNLSPPTISYKQGLYGKKHKLPPYNGKKRFEAYLSYYKSKFNGM